MADESSRELKFNDKDAGMDWYQCIYALTRYFLVIKSKKVSITSWAFSKSSAGGSFSRKVGLLDLNPIRQHILCISYHVQSWAFFKNEWVFWPLQTPLAMGLHPYSILLSVSPIVFDGLSLAWNQDFSLDCTLTICVCLWLYKGLTYRLLWHALVAQEEISIFYMSEVKLEVRPKVKNLGWYSPIK